MAKVDQTGVPMEDDFEDPTFLIQIPLYIINNTGLLHSGEGTISKTKEFYHGAFDFDILFSGGKNLRELELELYLVYGPNAERISIGDVLFNYREKDEEFFGCFEIKSTPELNLAMDTARSLTNREY